MMILVWKHQKEVGASDNMLMFRPKAFLNLQIGVSKILNMYEPLIMHTNIAPPRKKNPAI